MREAKPPFVQLAYALFLLFVGVAHEALSRPIQPITWVPGLALVPLGVGMGLALAERRWKTIAFVALYAAVIVVLFAEMRAATSMLPFCLLISAFGLTRFALFFVPE